MDQAQLIAAIDRNTAALILGIRVAMSSHEMDIDEWRQFNNEANDIDSLLWIKGPQVTKENQQ